MSIIDVFKTNEGKLVNFANDVHSRDTLEIVGLLAANEEVRKYILIQGEPFDFLKFTELRPID